VGDPSRGSRRRYDNSARAEKAAQTRERIVTAGSELVHAFDSWNWRDLTFRSVAERAGVGERTVYRHFPTERHLHDAVMQRLESEAGISYSDVDLDNLGEVTARVFASLQRFAVRESVDTPRDPTFVGVDARRREALLRAVTASAPHWTEGEQRVAAGLLDVLWNLPSYERLVGVWGVDGSTATGAVNWLMAKVIEAVADGDPPPA
jgi:AcrR family transcriptional regulator